MKTRLQLILVSCLLVARTATASAGDIGIIERYGLKGDQLGMSLDSFVQKYRRETGGSIAPFTSRSSPRASFGEISKVPGVVVARTHFPFECYDGPRVTVAGIPTDLEYLFISGSLGDRLYCIRGVFGVDGFESVKAALTAKYGPPLSEGQSPIQNRMGATFTNRTTMWVMGGDTIKLSLYGNDLEHSSITVAENAGLTESARRLEAHMSEKAKDL